MPLKGIFLLVTFPKVPRYGIMATQLLAMLTTIHHLLKHEIVVYLVNLRHLLHSIPLDVCFMSQLKRCFNVSFHELIIGCSIFEKIDPSRVFFFPLVIMWVGVLGAKTSRSIGANESTTPGRQLDHEDCVKPCIPFVFSPHVLNLGTRFLLSEGELSHP